MNKKTIVIFLMVTVVALGLVSPAFAQDQQPSANSGFFGIFSQFFARMFHPTQQNSGTDQNVPSDTQSDMPSSNPTGQPMDGARLQGLVTAGKITQAQEQEILSEISTIRSDIQSWSSSTGIDAGYVYGGLRGPGMSAGIGQNGQGTSSGTQGGPMQGGVRPSGTMMPPRAVQQY